MSKGQSKTMSLIDVKLSMTRCPWLLGRTDSAGSVVLARSASAAPSSFACYGPRTGPRLAHSSACGSICFAITSLPTESARLGCPTPNSCEVPCVAPPSGHRCNPCAGGPQSAGRARRRLKLSSAAPWLPAVSIRRSWTTPRIRRARTSRLVGASRKGAGNGVFEDGPAPDWTMTPAIPGQIRPTFRRRFTRKCCFQGQGRAVAPTQNGIRPNPAMLS